MIATKILRTDQYTNLTTSYQKINMPIKNLRTTTKMMTKIETMLMMMSMFQGTTLGKKMTM